MKRIILKTVLLILMINMSYSQSLNISNVEIVDDSTKKGRIVVLDNQQNVISNLQTDDFKIMENGKERKVISVSCPKEELTEPLSTVLTIDVSGSMQGMGMAIAKSAAMEWIEQLFNYNVNSECAITTFSTYSNTLSDFSTSPFWLKVDLNRLYPGGGTDYNQGFLGIGGGLQIANKGKYKKVLVFLSDGMPNYYPNEKGIIDFAIKNNITIHSIVLGFDVPSVLKNISYATGGNYYGNVNSPNEARMIYNTILKISQVANPCEITWDSDLKCGKIELIYLPNAAKKDITFVMPDYIKPKLDVSEKYINFGIGKKGFVYDTTIIVKAVNDSIRIDTITTSNQNIVLSSNNPDFPLTLNQNDSLLLNIKYSCLKDSSDYSVINILSDACEDTYIEVVIYQEQTDPKPEVRNNFGNLSVLTEINNLSKLDFKGYNLGLGLQAYIFDDIAVRISYGIFQETVNSLLTDRTNVQIEMNYISAAIRLNLFKNRDVLGYLSPYFAIEFGNESQEYHDRFSSSLHKFSYGFGIALGAEFFVFHNFSTSLETILGAKLSSVTNKLGFNQINEYPVSNSNGIFMKPRFNFIISYYIN